MMIDVVSGPFTSALHEAFVSGYWQKRPLLIRNFLPPEAVPQCCPITVEELLDLACDGGSSARLIHEESGSGSSANTTPSWTCKRGPLSSTEIARLTDSATHDAKGHYSVLLSNVEQVVPEVGDMNEYAADLWAESL